MNDEALGRLCIEDPALEKVLKKTPSERKQVYLGLTSGQRALLMFKALYGHSHTIGEFYWFINCFMMELKNWSEIKMGIRYFGDDEMLRIYEEIECILKARNKQLFDISINDLNSDSELFKSISPVYTQYQEMVPKTMMRIGAHIRSNLDENVNIDPRNPFQSDEIRRDS
ncbi:hypothetical protein [Thermoflavimicrobium dichotomicum]|uniref:hypothetical protein n=1 Tax=Thermoflavimicrobium dichotomicum TaxID=46223 RepID=UPI0011146253|nr:hypothetical protein [Thermoflavimicrobium dichotomicum]